MFLHHTLPNGIRIIGQKIPYLHSVSVGAWVATGSVKETEQEAGLSHFIEHMLFKGTARRSAQEIAEEMDSIGAQINAFTAKECTCFYVKAMDDCLEAAVDMLGDIVLHSELDAAEMEKEKGVVLEEILMAEDTPEDVVQETLNAQFFGCNPLAKPILGSKQSVSGFTRDDLCQYLHKHYRGGELLIAAAGNFDEAQLIDAVTRHFDAPGSGLLVPYPGAPSRAKKSVAAVEKDIEQVHIMLALPGYAMEDERYFPLALLSNALGGNMSSRLFQSIREQKGLAYSVYSYPMAYRDAGALALYAGTGAKQAGTVVQLMLDELRLLRKEGLGAQEFARCKNQIKGSYILGNESSGARMTAIGKQMLLFDRAQTEQEVLDKLAAVTQEDVHALLDDVLDEQALCAAFAGREAQNLLELGQLW